MVGSSISTGVVSRHQLMSSVWAFEKEKTVMILMSWKWFGELVVLVSSLTLPWSGWARSLCRY